MIKVLNLYAGIGGNRKLWTDMNVTAVEIKPKIAKIYQDFFPQDKVIVTDAHEYLLEHFREYDFIWSSPPCPTHSKARKWGCGVNNDAQNKPVYPDMKLYEEILFLKHHFKGKWVVENVVSYYKPFISARHYFWSNFIITDYKTDSRKHDKNVNELEEFKGFNLKDKSLGYRKDQVLRNCVHPKLGLHVFNAAFKDRQMRLVE